MPISREAKMMDNGNEAPKEFTAPQPRLFANIIEGILGGTLEWALIITGVMIAVALELCGVSALPVAVGMYLSLGSTMPIFIGGMMRLIADRLRGKPKSEAESETSPGVLLASGYIAGGTLCGLIIAFFVLRVLEPIKDLINLGAHVFGTTNEKGKLGVEAGRSSVGEGAVTHHVRPTRRVSRLHRQPQGGAAERVRRPGVALRAARAGRVIWATHGRQGC